MIGDFLRRDGLGFHHIMAYDTEINDATKALVAWFSTQEITTEDALVIMCRLIGSILVDHAESRTILRQRVSTIGNVIKNCSLTLWATSE
jgi:hypothetical protein